MQLRCALSALCMLNYTMALQHGHVRLKSTIKIINASSTSKRSSDECVALNPEQLAAVRAPLGATCVIAGPGTGKTRVLTQRIQHLIDNRKVDPQAILAVTFTRKAAAEMKLRLQPLLSSAADGTPLIGTFHSACLLMLREFGNELTVIAPGLNSKFGVFDVKASDKLLKAVMKSEVLQRALVEELPLNQRVELISDSDARRMISRAKCNGCDAQDYYQHVQDQIQTNKTRNPARLMQIAEIYRLYQSELRCNNKTNSKVCDTIGSRFLAVLVDEWQDSNTLQYKLIQLIVEAIHNIAASKAKNTKDTQAATLRHFDAIQPSIFVVGDPGLYVCKLFSNKSYTCYNSSMHSLCAQTSPHFTAHTVCYNTLHADQSIYGFRGARGGNIDQFRQQFQNCT
eukprot:17715-Heterococcus_DN1.PRE.5